MLDTAVKPFDLSELEEEKLVRGDVFITLLRSTEKNQNIPVCKDEMFWAKSSQTNVKYALQVVSALRSVDKLIVVVKRQHIQQPLFIPYYYSGAPDKSKSRVAQIH